MSEIYQKRCARCDAEFDIVRRAGAQPKYCPPCRPLAYKDAAYVATRKRLDANRVEGRLFKLVCPKCQVDYEWVGKRAGRAPRSCPECRRAKIRSTSAKWVEKNAEKIKRQNEAKRRADPLASSKARKTHLMRRYHITVGQHDEMLARQGGRCAICRVVEHEDVAGERLYIDHDHRCCPGDISCGQCVRALLCRHCNAGLGMFKESVDLLLAAVDYLTRTATTRTTNHPAGATVRS